MTDKMREEFEAWAITCAWLGLSDECMARDEINGGYYGLELHAAWLSWQASRAAVVVELPSRVDMKPYACYEGGWNDMHDEAREAIEAAGMKVKP